jgi:transcriptional regulator
MYVPAHFAADDAVVQDLLRNGGLADLITNTASGLLSTQLPLAYDPTTGEHGALHGHVARNNEHWKHEALGESLVILRGPDAYISPGWYASKREHGRVVPTWNYLTAHVYGRLVVHDDVVWLENLVRRLTEQHEATMPTPWSVDDAPPAFLAGQLRAIVGLELQITRIEAKAKYSQNRPPEDVEGVIEGLTGRGDPANAEAVRAAARAGGRTGSRPT